MTLLAMLFKQREIGGGGGGGGVSSEVVFREPGDSLSKIERFQEMQRGLQNGRGEGQVKFNPL